MKGTRDYDVLRRFVKITSPRKCSKCKLYIKKGQRALIIYTTSLCVNCIDEAYKAIPKDNIKKSKKMFEHLLKLWRDIGCGSYQIISAIDPWSASPDCDCCSRHGYTGEVFVRYHDSIQSVDVCATCISKLHAEITKDELAERQARVVAHRL